MKRQVVLVTGGTSGIGFECCRTLVQQPNTHVIFIGRNEGRVQQALAVFQPLLHATSAVEAELADLASLASVRALVNRLITKKLQFSAVVCNAGVEAPPAAKTVDGFETTFAVNHLSHFLLVTAMLEAKVFESNQKARIVIVSSALHNPESNGSFPPPDVTDWRQVAFGSDSWSSKTAYATSKLCNILFGYELERRYNTHAPDTVEVFMYSPGFVPDTGLFRNHSQIGWTIVKTLLKIVAWWKGSDNMRMSTPERSGAFLARLASDQALPWSSGSYFSIDHLFHTSEQSQDPALTAELWKHSMNWIDK